MTTSMWTTGAGLATDHRQADIVAFQPRFDPSRRARLGEATDETTARKIAMVRESGGPRFEQLELNVIVGRGVLVASRRRTRSSFHDATRSVAPALAATSYVLHGTLDQLRERILRRRDRLGISYYSLPFQAKEVMARPVAALRGR